jgi:hypothetical protein
MYWESSDTKHDELLTRSEVALIFRVSPSTVTRWGKEGRVPSILAPGGQRRYPKLAVERLAYELSLAQPEARTTVKPNIELNGPIDIVRLVHKAFRALSMHVEILASELEHGGDVVAFRKAFGFWSKQLLYHATSEDKYMTAPLVNCQIARDNEAEHAALAKQTGGLIGFMKKGETAGLRESVKSVMVSLEEAQHEGVVAKLEEVEKTLLTELGEVNVIARTNRQLYSQIVALRVAEFDHFENEETFVVPVVRDRMSEGQQLTVARHLLIDADADDPRWIIEWVSSELNAGEQKVLAALESSFPAIINY